jgi:hypothetical protein
MDHAVGPMQTGDGGTHWFWQGGMIWMGPAAQLRRNFVRDPIHQGVDMGVDTGSWWPDQPSNHGLVGKRVANVTGEYAEGSFTVTVDDASELQEGAYFRMVYRNKANIGDYDLYREMVGHPLMQNNFPWANATALNNFTQWVWPVRIAMIEGNQITLDQPLRIRTRAKFEVGFETMGLIVEESGIEDLRIELTSAPNRWDSHSHETRHNAIYLTKTINCWVRNVDVVNADNGIITRASKNIELRNFRILGDIRLHHGVTVVRGHDNLVTDFVIEPRVSHGISIEDLASGNVFSKGDMGFGTESGGGSFDSHRYLSFDILRTDIYVLNSIGRPGGNANTGPLNGRRVVHWNIRGNTGTNNGDYVNMPDAHSHGALVGVQGIRSNDAAWGMVPGDKGNIIADEGIVPIYPDLHQKQRELRMQMEAFVELQTPHLDLIPPGPTTLSAFANGGPGTIQSVVFKVDGSVIHTATTAPYEASWNPQPGAYEVELVMQTTSGTYRSPRRTIQVGQREIMQDNDARMVYTGPRTVVSDSAALGGTYTTFRGDQNAHVTFSFRGTRFMIYIHNLQPTQQRMNIFINDMSNPAQFINVRRFTEPRYMVYDSGPLPEGDYTVMIQPPSHQVMLDYVVIENTGEFGGGQLPNIPVAPSALQVSGTTDSQVSLAWTDNSTNETGFKIERSPNGSNSWSQIATVAANTTTYTDSGLAASTTYFYRVRAYNGDGDSPYTNVVSATTQSDADPVAPSAPQALLAQAMSSSRIDVTWTASSGSPDGYRIERSPNGTANWIEVGSVTADTTLFSSTGLQPATTYFYRVRAYNQAGDSPYSSTANATTYAVGAEPQFVFLDNFADNDRTVNPAWFVVDNPANVEVSQSGGVLSLGRLAPNSHTYLASHWSGTTLAVGDELVMSFRARMTGNPGNRNNEIVFAVGNNNGTTVAVDGDSASYVDDFGYFAALGFGTGVSSIYRDVGGNHLLGRPGTADQTILASSGAGELSLSNEFKDYTLTLERTASGLEITLSDGVNSLTITDTSVPNSSFHTFNTVTFGYYNRNTAHSLDVDDLRVWHGGANTGYPDPNPDPDPDPDPAGAPYLLSMSTYLGDDSDNDEVVALRILSDGTIAVAANIGA